MADRLFRSLEAQVPQEGVGVDALQVGLAQVPEQPLYTRDLDIRRLGKALRDAGFGPILVVIGDLFAAGCYFLSTRRSDLGLKLCRIALGEYVVELSLLQRVLDHVEEYPFVLCCASRFISCRREYGTEVVCGSMTWVCHHT